MILIVLFFALVLSVLFAFFNEMTPPPYPLYFKIAAIVIPILVMIIDKFIGGAAVLVTIVAIVSAIINIAVLGLRKIM